MKDRKETWRMIKFTLFSISAGIIQIVTYTLFYDPGRAILCGIHPTEHLVDCRFDRRESFHRCRSLERAFG